MLQTVTDLALRERWQRVSADGEGEYGLPKPFSRAYNNSALSSVQPLSLAYGSTAPLVGEPLASR